MLTQNRKIFVASIVAGVIIFAVLAKKKGWFDKKSSHDSSDSSAGDSSTGSNVKTSTGSQNDSAQKSGQSKVQQPAAQSQQPKSQQQQQQQSSPTVPQSFSDVVGKQAFCNKPAQEIFHVKDGNADLTKVFKIANPQEFIMRVKAEKSGWITDGLVACKANECVFK